MYQRTWVVVQPEYLQHGQLEQVPDFLQVADVVLAQVQLLRVIGSYLQFVATGEVLQARYAIHTKGHDFEVGHLLDEGQVLQVVAPQVEVLDVVQAVGLGLGEN